VLAGIILGLALFFGSALVKSAHASPIPQLVRPVVTSVHGDDMCSTVFDYCVQVRCGVENRGLIGGRVDVELAVEQGSGAPLVHTQSVYLESGESKNLAHDFTEASLFGKNSKVRCRPL
jgi:hypothetical protein